MTDVLGFGLVVGVIGVAAYLAVMSNRISERVRVPAPAIFLLVAALASDLIPRLGKLSVITVQRVVTLALILLLFHGGMNIGWRKFRSAAGAIAWVGVAGTFVTAGGVAVLGYALFGFDWRMALLLGTALAPTDPAVVFSVLGRREVAGRTGVLLEGESGANDPVGITLMASLLTAEGVAGWRAVGAGVGEFGAQMVVGAGIGLLGGIALRALMRVPLPSGALYPVRTLAAAGAIYGVATVAHGSGFLAVFVAGIVIGDFQAPYKGDVLRFHASLASLSEIIAFTILGLTVSLRSLVRGDSLWVGLALAVLLTFAVRPVLVGLLLLPVRLRGGERAFVLWSGLKGAVPVLLGTFVIGAGLPGAGRLYEVVLVVVAFSVMVQGGLLPFVARRCGVPMRTVEPEPWSLGVRLRHEPRGLHRYVVGTSSAADGRRISALEFGEDAWISFISREGRLVQVRDDVELRAGDEVLVLADPAGDERVAPLFRGTTDVDSGKSHDVDSRRAGRLPPKHVT
jgi:cell volume regulation protein A